MSQEQLQLISELQDKFINGEITKNTYEHEKNRIVNSGEKNSYFGEEDFSKLSDSDCNDSNFSKIEFVNIFTGIFTFIISIFNGISSVCRYIHKKFVYIADKRKLKLWKVYLLSLIILIALVLISQIGINSYNSHVENIKEKEKWIEWEQKNQQSIERERNNLIELINNPYPSITLLSSTGSQGRKSEYYILKFKVTDTQTIYIDYTSEVISVNGSGTYERSIWIPDSKDTTIKITAKNKHFEKSEEYTVSREETDDEIQANKNFETQMKAQEILAEKEKKQQLDDDKKTYSTISYAKLSKNPNTYIGKRIKFNGKIFNAKEDGNTSIFQINTDEYGYGDQIFTVANWLNDYVENNWITVWGEVEGEYCYISQDGSNICVPRVKANILE